LGVHEVLLLVVGIPQLYRISWIFVYSHLKVATWVKYDWMSLGVVIAIVWFIAQRVEGYLVGAEWLRTHDVKATDRYLLSFFGVRHS